MELSRKYSQITPSVTLAISAKAKKMKSEGIDVISFSVGEPDFRTPENIRKRAIEAIEKDDIGYTAASGMPALKKAIVDKLKRENNLSYEEDQIVVSNGGKHSLTNVIEAISNPEDEIIVPCPYWVSYPEMVKMAGAKVVFSSCPEENDFKYDLDKLKEAITDNTKALILNSPSNPAGAVYSKEELQVIGDLAVKHDFFIISDEIYEKLVYGDEKHISIASLSDEIKERTIVMNGMAKAYAMTGWRIGYTASNKTLAKMMSNIQSHATSNPNTIAQYASIEGLSGSQASIEAMRKEFEQRRGIMHKLINDIPGLKARMPKGAFYMMVNIEGYLNTGVEGKSFKDSIEFADYVLEKANVALVPGIAFGDDRYVRLSYATSVEKIEEGLSRIKTLLG